MPAGYSGTPLVKKLGLKTGQRAIAVNAPPHYGKLLGTLPAGFAFETRAAGTFDFMHVFASTQNDLKRRLPMLKKKLAYNGLLWVSWPKKTSALSQDLSENDVREIGLAAGLVDVKVCAVDDDWSGLKFVYRLQDRLTATQRRPPRKN